MENINTGNQDDILNKGSQNQGVRKGGQNQGEETRTKIVEAMRNKPEISRRDYAEMEKECEKAKAEHGTRQIERLYKKLLQSAQNF